MNGYQLKITIRGSKPPIWRRVIVPDKITFADLDDVIECIFGWTHEHLYNFYFRDTGDNITFDPEGLVDTDVRTECIDDWFWEGRKILYTYDFGDDWEHDIVVEKFVLYEHRYAEVAKSKGPYMIEDCGGLWGFYSVIDDAEEFDIDEANRRLRKMKFEETEMTDRGDDTESYWECDNPPNPAVLRELIERLGELQMQEIELTQQWIDENRDLLSEDFSLREVFEQYTKKDMIMLAQANGFTRYSGFKKKELAEWLANHLLDTVYMTNAVKRMSEAETRFMEKALETPEGTWADSELVDRSVFLGSYGAYSPMHVLRIPADVREKYDKLCTPRLKEEREKRWKWNGYCESAVYRYGVIPVPELIKIYGHYTQTKLTKEEVVDIFEEMGEQKYFCLKENLLMDPEFVEDGKYRYILGEQANLPYYLPDTEEAFLAWYEAEGQEKREDEEFDGYLQKKCGLDEAHAHLIWVDVKRDIRDGYTLGELMEELEDSLEYFGKELSSYKKYNEAEKLMKKLVSHTRVPQYRGHSPAEVRRMEEDRRKQSRNVVADQGNGKIINFPSERKIYPNDPCPCGSGKKYKHCCGRNK